MTTVSKSIFLISIFYAMGGCATAKDKPTGQPPAPAVNSSDPGGITSGGLPVLCNPNNLLDKRFSDGVLVIEFWSNGSAGVYHQGDDEHYAVSYTTDSTCYVKLSADPAVHELANGRTLLFDNASSLVDRDDRSIVFKAE